MVDYSKWDKMDFSDSSDNEEEDSKVPRVTALDSESSVTFGGDGNIEISKSSSTSQPRQSQSSTTASDIPVVSSSVSGDTIDISTMNDINNNLKDDMQQDTNNKTNKIQQLQTQLTLNGGEHYCIVNTSKEKELKLPIYWSQDRYTVTIRLGFSPLIFPSKSIRVHVKGALKYTDRFSAVGSGGGIMSDDPSFGSIEVTSLDDKGEETILLYGSLPRPIHLNEGEDEIDFEIEDNHHLKGDNSECTKLVSITLPKAVPMAGLVLWWDCPLIGFPQIDVSTIQGRQGSKGDSMQQDDKKEAWKNAWDEAHVMFKEKVKTRVKQEINVDE